MPPPTSPPASTRNSLRGYLSGLAVIVAGLIGAGAWAQLGSNSLANSVAGFHRVPLAGGAVLFDRPGTSTVYYEGPGNGNEQDSIFRDVLLSGPQPGMAVHLSGHAASLAYDLRGHRGRAVATVHVPRAGRYFVQSAVAMAREGPAGAEADLAFGPSLSGRVMKIVLPAVIFGLLAFVVGLVVIVVTSVRQVRGLRE